MEFSSLFTKDKSTERESMQKMLIQLVNILPFDIVNPVQTINIINSKKANK